MTPPAKDGAAGAIAALVKAHAGADLPVRLRLWDGSEAGPDGGPVLVPAPRGRCAASCGARASSAWPAPTSAATSTSKAT